MGNKWASTFNLRWILAILILGSLVLLTAVLWRQLENRPAEESLEILPKKVDLALGKLHYTQNEDGQSSWSLSADQAEYLRESGQARLDQVHLEIFRAGEFGKVTLDAGQGQLLQESQQLEVWDQVVVRTSRQERLVADRLHYDGVQRRLTADGQIELQTPRVELTGKGLQIELDQGRLLLKSGVRMLVHPAQQELNTRE